MITGPRLQNGHSAADAVDVWIEDKPLLSDNRPDASEPLLGDVPAPDLLKLAEQLCASFVSVQSKFEEG